MASDNFTRANESPIASPWTKPGGSPAWNSLRLVSNAAATTASGGSDAMAYYSGSAQGDSSVTIGVIGGSDGGPAIHLDSSGNGYCVTCFDSNVHVFRVTAGVNYTDITNATTVCSYGIGDVIRLRRSGTSIVVTKNGSAVQTIVDNTFTGGFDGMFMFDDTLRFSAWSNNAVAASQGRDLSKFGPGVSPDKRMQFAPRLLSTTIQGLDVSVALTGQSASFSLGTLTQSGGDTRVARSLAMGPGISPDYTKVFSARQLGFTTPGAPLTLALTGVFASYSQGTLTPSLSVALTGVACTFSQGTLGISRTTALSGSAGTFSAGTLAPSLSIPLAGQSATFSQGNVSVAGDKAVALTGLQITFAQGTLAPGTSKALTGQAITSSAGIVGHSASIAITGIATTVSGGVLVASGGDVVVLSTPNSRRINISKDRRPIIIPNKRLH